MIREAQSVRSSIEYSGYRRLRNTFFWALIVGVTVGCVSQPEIEKKDYSKLREANPRSILVVPAINKSIDVDAPDYFLSTAVRPIAERGYYVFPVHLVKRVMEDDGLSDADLVHAADPVRLATLFGADAVFYVSIERWDAKYAVFSTTVTVEFVYVLKSGMTGEELWRNTQYLEYTPDNSNSSGNGLADLIAAAIVAAVEKASPSYIPLTQKANGLAVGSQFRGLPAGPYRADYGLDQADFEGIEPVVDDN